MILERGKGWEKERERNIDVREKHRLAASCTRPDWGPNLQPSHVPWIQTDLITWLGRSRKGPYEEVA